MFQSRCFQILCLLISLMSHCAYSQPSAHSQNPVYNSNPVYSSNPVYNQETVYSQKTVYNEQLASLYEQGNVKLNAWLSHTRSDIAVHEQVTLNIEVMTDTWFTQGTKVHRVEVDNAVVLPISSFAVNSTVRIDGKVYSSQLWEIVLYPLQSGEYLIPPVALEVGVKQGRNSVEGIVMTKALSFDVHKPSVNMMPDRKWLTGKEAKIEEKWTFISQNEQSQSLEGKLKVGDAITREITLSAQDTISMLLPEVVMRPDTSENEFLFYRESTKYNDSEQRGVRQAQSFEKVTYIVNSAGEVTIPAISIFWWDSESQTEKKLILPELRLDVSHTFTSLLKEYKVEISVGIGFLLLVVLGCVSFYRFVKTQPNNKWVCLVRATYNKDIVLYETAVYQILLVHFQRRVLAVNQESVDGIGLIWRRYQKSAMREQLANGDCSRFLLVKTLLTLLMSARASHAG
ncbi:BatD family protein [Vibrio splendidus]|uniref:BatD family protein n=1 Tax=Vibrio splendidus TaxID=29497 RepID=UPI000D08ECCE|nr:BatD family protein [Vibrio splendidus]